LTANIELKHCQDLLNRWAKSSGDVLDVISTAWALVLRCYTGLDDVCFGYQDNRKAVACTGTIADSQSGLSIARMKLDEKAPISKLIAASRDYLIQRHTDQRNMSADASRSMRVSRKLFNTAMFFQNSLETDFSAQFSVSGSSDEVSFEILDGISENAHLLTS
jgi:hypothetical protein